VAYQRQSISFGPPLTQAVKGLIVVNSAVFLLTYVAGSIISQTYFWQYPKIYLGLVPWLVIHNLFLWQPLTYLFLHAGFFHIIFNMFALWMFGADLERLWGSAQFLFFYLLCGVGAGLCNVLLQPSSQIPTIGASGAIYGLLLAYGMLFPDRPILLYFFIPIKAKWFVAILALIEFVSSFQMPESGISHIAHLGGMLVAFLYLRGRKTPLSLQMRYQDWRRARLRKKFEVYMRREDHKDSSGRWIN
jgi:membrane associated rhomboid family serine protease